jgi:hypothetical protein
MLALKVKENGARECNAKNNGDCPIDKSLPHGLNLRKLFS